MKYIAEKNKFIYKIIGNQSVVDDAKYRLLNNVIIEKIDNYVLLYNLITDELILLSQAEYAALKEYDINNSNVATLIKEWFIVPEQFDDAQFFNQIKSFADIITDNESKKNGITDYIIFTTTDCNARCFYCYESGCSKISMTEAIANDVSNYIINKSNNNKVKIGWFGGEPLYNNKVIDIICLNLKKRNVEYSSSMVSNGYLFDEELLYKAVNLWKLKKVQITLDGTEEVYNRFKNYVYNEGSAYVRVINNIKKLLDIGIKVNIRLNMDEHNAENLHLLVDNLAEQFGNYDNIMVYTHLLFDNTSGGQQVKTDEQRHNLYKKMTDLKKHIVDKGLSGNPTLSTNIMFNHCMADSLSSTTILPDGRLGKCEHYLEDNSWGSIYSDKEDLKVVNSFKKRYPDLELCKSCPIRPRCIRLKKCPNEDNKCNNEIQEYKIEGIKRQMVNTYLKYLKENNN